MYITTALKKKCTICRENYGSLYGHIRNSQGITFGVN